MAGNEEAEPQEAHPNGSKPEQEVPQEIIPAELVDKVPEELKEIVKDLSKVGDKETVMRIISIAEQFSGPLPHPRIMGQYAAIMPEAPERIFTMAKEQQDHRMSLETKVIEGDIRRADRGLVLGFIFLIVFAIGGLSLLFIGKDVQGYVALGTSVLGGVGNFIKVGVERSRATQEQAKRKRRKAPSIFAKKKTTKPPA